MTKRAILSLSEETLQKADALAEELGVSRAEFIRRAINAYAEELRKKKEEEAILLKREKACRETDRLREEFSKIKDPNWDPVRIIREWRDKDRLDRMYERQEKSVVVAREKRKKP
jgi:hypothetical protein